MIAFNIGLGASVHIEATARRLAKSPETYKKRRELVEHPLGTIKIQ